MSWEVVSGMIAGAAVAGVAFAAFVLYVAGSRR